jgi:hypothetical protein
LSNGGPDMTVRPATPKAPPYEGRPLHQSSLRGAIATKQFRNLDRRAPYSRSRRRIVRFSIFGRVKLASEGRDDL